MQFEKRNGAFFAVIKRRKGEKLTDPCPFCREKHEHGRNEGHRMPHCDPQLIESMQIKEVDGIAYMPAKYGYILREYETNAVSDIEQPQESNEDYFDWANG